MHLGFRGAFTILSLPTAPQILCIGAFSPRASAIDVFFHYRIEDMAEEEDSADQPLDEEDSVDQLLEVFRSCDGDGDDVITTSEVDLLCSKLQLEEESAAELKNMLQNADERGEGKVGR